MFKKLIKGSFSQSPSSNPTHTPTRELLNSLTEGSATSVNLQIDEPPSEDDPAASTSSPIVFERSSGDAKIPSNPKSLQNHSAYASFDQKDPEEKQRRPEPGSNAKQMPHTEVNTLVISNKIEDDDARVLAMRKCLDPALGGAPRTDSLEVAEVTELLSRSAASTGLIETKQNRNTSSSNKKKLGRTSKVGNTGASKAFNPTAHDVRAADNTKQSSEGPLELRLKTRRNTKTLTPGSCHDGELVSERPRRGSQTDLKGDAYPQNKTQGMSIPQNGHPRQKPRRMRQTSASKIDSGEDGFSDCTPKVAYSTQKSNVQSPAKFQINISPRSSVRNAKSAAKKSRAQPRDESPTPKGSRRKPSETNGNNSERRENMQPLPSPGLLLSDLSQWPALGTGKAQIDLKTNKPLVDRTQQPGPIRRDSLTSVVSSASPRPVHRLT